MLRRLVNNKLERIWKEAIMVQSRYYPSTFLEGRSKTTEKLGTVGVLPEIRTEYIPHTNVGCYHYINLLRDPIVLYTFQAG
jgi:hypothetical protein